MHRKRGGGVTNHSGHVHQGLSHSDKAVHLGDQSIIVTRATSVTATLARRDRRLVADALFTAALERLQLVDSAVGSGGELPECAHRLLLVTVAGMLIPRKPGADSGVQAREETKVRGWQDPNAFAVLFGAAVAAAKAGRVGTTTGAVMACTCVSALKRNRSRGVECAHPHRGA